MNRIYRIIWSRVTNTWIAVSENAKGCGKSASAKKCVVGAAAALLGPLALAAPVGGEISAGSGTITQAGLSTTISQTSQNLAINWQSFGSAANESINFVQPNASSIALNRVLGQDPSQLLGSLSANGQVFILNPNGVLFGKGSQVNVGGLVASTLSLSDADFMAGKYSFSGTSTGPVQTNGGSVVNRGNLTAAEGGYIALLAPEVRNEGVISATLGTALLAAGDKITLNLNNGSLLSYSIDQGSLKALADNKQLIQADGGQVLMSAKAADALATAVVNNTGVIEARTIRNVNGVIKLMGDMQVGTVNVGGTLDASAPTGGDGGFVETSAAHVQVTDNAIVTTASANGSSGTWLIDPTNFTISSGSATQTASGIGATTLATALGSGNVSIATSSTANGGDLGDINVNAAVGWSANKLTLTAHNNININANLDAGAAGSLALEYGQGAIAANNTSNYTLNNGAVVNLPAGQNFSTRLGSDGTVRNYTVITDLGAAGSVTGTDLQGINGSLTGNYVLGANIDAVAINFTPLGTATTSFTGIFDGLGHTISNLTINLPSVNDVGLFGYAGPGATIQNVGLVGGSVFGGIGADAQNTVGNTMAGNGGNVGALVGYNNGGLISNSYSSAGVSGGNGGRFYGWGIPGGGNGGNVGGLVGYNAGMVRNSHATAGVSGGNGSQSNSTEGNGGSIGGLVGNNAGSILDSHATGSVDGANGGTLYIKYAGNGGRGGNGGGLAGSNSGTIDGSYATGSVTGANSGMVWTDNSGGSLGGLVGASTGAISNSHATGNVDGANGNQSANGNSLGGNVGGLVGTNYSAAISNSYATGNVGGGNGGMASSPGVIKGGNVGGLVGQDVGGTIGNSYATGNVNGANSSYILPTWGNGGNAGGLVGGGHLQHDQQQLCYRQRGGR